MSSIGNPAVYQETPFYSGTGNGSLTSFPLTWQPGTAAALRVFVGGVVQTPGSSYYVSGYNLIFTNPPDNGAKILAFGIGVRAVTNTPVDTTPMFSVQWWVNRAAIPAGYVPADGQLLSRLTYPDAWIGISSGNVPLAADDATWISTPTERGKFTVGDGSTTFRMPDYNGKSAGSLGAAFLRGDGAMSAGVDGVIQQDQNKSHSHDSLGYSNLQTGLTRVPGAALAGPGPDALTATSGGNESRPLNVTGCWIVRLFGAVTNPGAADAAQLATEVAKLQAEKVPFAAFLGANQSLAASGYQKLPGGLILQWGTYAGGATTGTINFPIAFPTNVFSVTSSSKNSASQTQNISLNPSLASFTFGQANSGAFMWLAVGG